MQSVQQETERVTPNVWHCGCVTGRRLCAEALRLWSNTCDEFTRALPQGDYEPYRQACSAFGAHYTAQEDRQDEATCSSFCRTSTMNGASGRDSRLGRTQAAAPLGART